MVFGVDSKASQYLELPKNAYVSLNFTVGANSYINLRMDLCFADLSGLVNLYHMHILATCILFVDLICSSGRWEFRRRGLVWQKEGWIRFYTLLCFLVSVFSQNAS